MLKTFWVARREFMATVLTKAFVFAVLVMPVLMVAVITLTGMLMNKAAPTVTGRVAVIDRTGLVGPRLADLFKPEEIAKRREAHQQRVAKELGKMAPVDDKTKEQMQQSVGAATAMVPVPTLTVEQLPKETDVQVAREEILKAAGKEKDAQGENPRLALVVVAPDAVVPQPDKKFGAYDYYVAPKLDIEIQSDIQSQVNRALIDARLAANGMDVDRVRQLTERPDVDAKAVTKEGDKSSSEIAKILIPGGFMILLWISVFTSGQYLLTSTIEEKSSRVMEVLLSAVSPMQLLIGKVFGQMAVGLLILCLYAGLGIVSLVVFSMKHLLDPMGVVYLVVFFMLAFFMIASMMAAIGSAVTDVREAQSLLGPAMIVLMIPMMLWMPIMRNPNSMFAQVCSFIPPVSPFVMVLRLSGSEKIATWQIPVSILVALIGAIVFAWSAAKIFRIGVLMYGKPPNFKTLLKWVRMA